MMTLYYWMIKGKIIQFGSGEIKIKELNSELTDFAQNAREQTLFRIGLSELATEGY